MLLTLFLIELMQFIFSYRIIGYPFVVHIVLVLVAVGFLVHSAVGRRTERTTFWIRSLVVSQRGHARGQRRSRREAPK
jgi:UPF0716 family protein affecting phage T7 exclusion